MLDLRPVVSRLRAAMPTGRTKKKLKSRPSFKQERSLRDRRIKAKKKAAHKRGLHRGKKRRAARGSKKK